MLRELHTYRFRQPAAPWPPAQAVTMEQSPLFPYHLGRVLNTKARQNSFPVLPILWLVHCFAEKQAVVPTQLSPSRVPYTQECGIPTITCSTPQNLKILVSSLKVRHWTKPHLCTHKLPIKWVIFLVWLKKHLKLNST